MKYKKFFFIINSFIELNELHFLIELLIKNKINFELLILKRVGLQQEKNKLKSKHIVKFFSKRVKTNFFKNYDEVFYTLDNSHNIVISTHPYNHMFGNKKKNFFFVLFQSVFDTFNLASLNGLEKSDLIFLHTNKWFDFAKKLFGKKIEKLDKKIFCYGTKKLINEKNTAKNIKNKFKFKKNKKIIILQHGNFNKMLSVFNSVYLSQNRFEMIIKFIINSLKFKTFCLESFNLIIRNQNYKKFVDALEYFKKKNNCYLVTKYRTKFIPPDYVRKISDKFIDDRERFPQPSITLAKISDLMIHFHSTGVLEAVYFDVPVICVMKPSNLTINKNSNTYRTHILTRPKDKKSIFNFKSVNPKFNVTSIIDVFKNYKSKSLFKVNKEHYFQYKKSYIEDDYVLSSKKIYNLILFKHSKKYE
jgi:hypothetical protein